MGKKQSRLAHFVSYLSWCVGSDTYLQVATARVLELLGDPSKWEDARSLISSPPLASEDFVKTLDRYSDSNWEKHILGDLYRNEGLANLKVGGCLSVRRPNCVLVSLSEFSVLLFFSDSPARFHLLELRCWSNLFPRTSTACRVLLPVGIKI